MKSEMDLAARVVAYLEQRGWAVYQEVAPRTYDARADIVAVRGPLLHVVECKTAFGFAVLDQARYWLRSANLVSVATPPHRARDIGAVICGSLGLGWLIVGYEDVREEVGPVLRRRAAETLRKCLRPEHQTHARAGSNGGYFSAWRATTARLVELLGKYPHGLVTKQAVALIKHHYATDKSARDCLTRDVEAGRVLGVVLDRQNYGGPVFRPALALPAATDGAEPK